MSSKKSKITLFSAPPALFARPFAAVDYPQCVQLARQGHSAQAQSLLQTLLKSQPGHAEAWQLLAMLQMNERQWHSALQSWDRALQLGIHTPALHNNRGIALRELGRFDDAIAAYDNALQLQPDYLAGWINKGNCLRRLQRSGEAIQAYEQALALEPHHTRAMHAKALCLQDLGELAQAKALLLQLLDLDSDSEAAWLALANIHDQEQQYDSAMESYQQVLLRDPTHYLALNGLGLAHQALRQNAAAEQAYERAIRSATDAPEAYANLAALQVEMKQYERAMQLYKLAEAKGADRLGILQHWGELYADMRLFSQASDAYQKLCELAPEFDFALSSYFSHSMKSWHWQRAQEVSQRLWQGLQDATLKMIPFEAIVYSDDQALHLRIAKRHVQQIALPRCTVPLRDRRPAGGDRIRVAYVSADFHDHATMHLMQETFEQHDHTAFEWTAVSLGSLQSEEQRAWLERHFDQVIDASTLGDAPLIDRLRSLNLDIAVDLKGHTSEARFALFESRIAPVQVNYLGYPGTTGSTAMDFILGDAIVTPDSAQHHYTERIWPLPGSYQVNNRLAPIDEPPARAEVGLPNEAFVFACFNNHAKINEPSFAVWMRLLHATPRSVLWLLGNEDAAQERLRAEAMARGVDPHRLVFSPRASRARHLARHRLADLFLDTAPYGAHTTASDVLRTGSVMLALQAQSFASRVSASLLSHIGCPELIAQDTADYEAKALSLAQNPAQLQALRAKVCAAVAQSDLFDPAASARKLEAAYRGMLAAPRNTEPH